MTALVTPRLLQFSTSELAMVLVSAGQPWCENSIDGPLRPPEETRAAEIVAPFLVELGFEVEFVGRYAMRQNLVATRRFGPGLTLMLNDHLDTYPAGPPSRWTKCDDPFQAAQHGDRLYARGTSDTRGNLTALLSAVGKVCADPPEAGTLLVALTVDEERNGVEGALYLMEEQGLRPSASITIEPTGWTEGDEWGLGIAVQHTGHALVDLTVSGRSSHIWRPDTGINAAHYLLNVLQRLKGDALPEGWGCSVVGLDAGERGMAQFTPLTATARMAIVGLGPDVARADVPQRVTEVAREVLAVEDEPTEVEVVYVAGPTMVPGTIALPPEEPVVAALRRAYRDVAGTPARDYAKPAYCDTIRFRHADIPAVTFGPGDDGWAVYDESISIKRMDFAADVLAKAVRDLLTSHGAR